MYSLNRSHITYIINLMIFALLMLTLILTGSTAFAEDKKQIKIEQFSLNRSVAYFGEEISASVTVSAQPAFREKVLRLRYYLDDNEIGTQTVTEFDPTGNANSVFSFNGAAEGRFLFRVILDIDGEKIQADEVSRQLAILSLPGGMSETQLAGVDDETAPTEDPSPGKPDLEPVQISFNIASPRVGQKIQITSKISNIGDVQADNVLIRMFINGQPYGDDITMNIAAGTQANIETEYLPANEGKKDILVLINPEGEIDEISNRNNLLSKILVVRPAEKATKLEETVAKTEIETTKKDRANLVVYIETISGVHYTTDGKVRIYITNNSQTVETKPFTMGAQLLQGSQGKLWLIRKPVKALKPGETTTLSLNWPENQFSTSNLYVATADIDGVIDETDVRDNNTRPFRVVSTAVVDQTPAFTLERPRKGERLADNRKLEINWKSSGDTGKRIRISVLDNETKDKILSSVTSNDGQHSIDLTLLDAGEYMLSINPEDSAEVLASSVFYLTAKRPSEAQKLVSPKAGTSYRGGQELKIIWPQSIRKTPGLRLDFFLQETSNKKIVKLNKTPVDAASEGITLQVPDDGSLFGIYTLNVNTPAGKQLARSGEIVLLPNFVSFDQPESDQSKDEIIADLEIARTSFNGKNLEFLVMNNGPAEISASALLGYKFTSYFVRKVPIVSAEDLVICQSSLLAELPQGEGQIISLGRNPDCPLGEREYGSKFVYVVNHFTLPKLLSQRLIDPKPLNNLSKFYWPE
ncbi:MAG: CARDB domain-containing protein [Arenicellales bacterium]